MTIPNEYLIPTDRKWKCLYCGNQCKLCSGSLVYHGSKKYRDTLVWVCSNWPDCNAYVGCHKGTDIPLGHPANAELRELRCLCHKQFDPLWKRLAKTFKRKGTRDRGSQYTEEQINSYAARNIMYKKLARYMKLPEAICHIACFNTEQCHKVLKFVKYYNTIYNTEREN